MTTFNIDDLAAVGEWIVSEQRGSPTHPTWRVVHGASHVHGELMLFRAEGVNRRMLSMELANLVELHAPGLTQMLDYGFEGEEILWVVTAPAVGASLATLLGGGPERFDGLYQVARLFRPVGEALGELHRIGMHTIGLSPDSILVDANGAARLRVEFAVPATRISSPEAEAEIPQDPYAAPEERVPGAVDPGLVDVYRFAALFFRCLEGDAFFAAAVADPGSEGLIPREGPESLRRSVYWATHRDPTKRVDYLSALVLSLVDIVESDQVGPDEAYVEEEVEGDGLEEALDPDDPRYDPPERSVRLAVIMAGLLVAFFAATLLTLREYVNGQVEGNPTEEVVAAPESSGPTSTPQVYLTPAAVAQRPLGLGPQRSPEYIFPLSWLTSISGRTWRLMELPGPWSSALSANYDFDYVAPDYIRVQRPPVPSDTQERILSFKPQFLPEGRIRFEGIWGDRRLTLAIPQRWRLVEAPEVQLTVRRSPSLIPEVSMLGLWADGDPAWSVRLNGDVHDGRREVFTLHGLMSSGVHDLRLFAYHRSQLPCELTVHSGLWSEIVANSYTRVRFVKVPPILDLASWPMPFVDLAEPDPLQLVIVVPEGATDGELHAAGLIAAALGDRVGDHLAKIRIYQGSLEKAPAGDAIVISTGATSPSTVELGKLLASDMNPEVAAVGRSLAHSSLPAAGTLALFPRPDDQIRAVLAVVAADDAAVVGLGQLLAYRHGVKLVSGRVEALNEFQDPEPSLARAWEGVMPESDSFTLADLGLDDQTVSGFHGGPVTVPLRMVPDERPLAGSAHVNLVYSYSARADAEGSKLNIYLNDELLSSTKLSSPDGAGMAQAYVDLPVHRMGPDSKLVVSFELRPQEGEDCLGEMQDPIWGTLHATTRFVVPRARWHNLSDLGLLKFGGYPFGIQPDYSDLTFVLPKEGGGREADDLQAYVELAAEFGRVSRGDHISFNFFRGSPEEAKALDTDVVVVTTQDTDPGLVFKQEDFGWISDHTALIAALPSSSDSTGLLECEPGKHLFDRLEGDQTVLSSCEPPIPPSGQARELAGRRPIATSAATTLSRFYWWIVGGTLFIFAFVIFVRSRRREIRQARDGGLHAGRRGSPYR